MAAPIVRSGDSSSSRFLGSSGSVAAPILGAIVAGAVWAVGALWYFPENPDSWLGRVISSWVNLFSFIAFGSAIGILFDRWLWLIGQEQGFAMVSLPADSDALILSDDALQLRQEYRQLDDRQKQYVPVQLLGAALQRSRAHWSAQDAGDAVKTQAELLQGQHDSQYSILRYLAWVIPAIGFIGTVMGIGDAMGPLKQGLGSESAGADPLRESIGHLHVAFDTTFVALVFSVVLMYVLHRVQARDDRFLVRATDWCMQRYVFRMHIPKEPIL